MEKNSPDVPRYQIKIASSMTGVDINLIRLYERVGLLKPYREPDNNYRLFTEEEVEWIRRIKKLINEVGFNIVGIKSILTIKECWTERNCPDEIKGNCSSFLLYNHPCWMNESKPYCCQGRDCYNCQFYLISKKHPKLLLK
jgi:MerR family transcriptional regulator, heat shock protein HspR